ncbi:MAG: UDP-N-acetylmuramate:L-alanyl-gamma-D-glutamyl-meso-diaminopimelate ligase [Gammaproteobacteria bacterium]|nr:MAG: UDP-N-acetylmuramate:L-alanyl-gamma-D-glutamyl-meso-diaminopimelate ligase [Pseudomonadota bacterium]PIE38621.1 MAG: UDP-N-acetylmuramate:L-alanyl-gamma-D-glutamyl-meso-diaminopimelate ligase [Gammaproteobacteria bacterium]
MRIHILGICGTFMGSLAVLAKQSGHQVSGSDQGIYPPMSTQLEQQGVTLMQGYLPEHLQPAPDLVVIGNALSRGNPAVEYVLENNLDYVSGPEWFARHVLKGRWTLAVAGTHGKTTTSAMLAWILEYAGKNPGFLIGGVPKNFSTSARPGEGRYFVVEADEYDSAFFDKRSKFVHYRPRTLIINNLEFDHADIFDDLSDIQRQFNHLIRTVPGSGRVIYPAGVAAIDQVLEQGCWSEQEQFYQLDKRAALAAGWQIHPVSADGTCFDLTDGTTSARVNWSLTGAHNMSNAMAAMLAARHVGVMPEVSAEALGKFSGVKRRMELLATIGKVSVYDDFAHHPTAIATTLEGLRKRVGQDKIVALIEPRSNTMKLGVHQSSLAASAAAADAVIWANTSQLDWLPKAVSGQGHFCEETLEALVNSTLTQVRQFQQERFGVHLVVMSNGGFGGIHTILIDRLGAEWQSEPC